MKKRILAGVAAALLLLCALTLGGMAMTAAATSGHPHVAEADWQADDNGHWHNCTVSGCTEKLDYRTHTFNVDRCADCNYKCNHSNYSDWKYTDDIWHWKECTSCSRKEYVEYHVYFQDLRSDQLHHFKKCETCGYEHNKEAHIWIGGSCSVCGRLAPPVNTHCATGHASYTWQTVTEPDVHNDGEEICVCEGCGQVLYRVPLSAYGPFQKVTAEKIQNAAQGATVEITTSRWYSFHRSVMEALAARPDVTLVVSFLSEGYKGDRLTFTIPAGTDTVAFLNEEGYAGFFYISGMLGTLRPAN